jgi:hypothetical protein
MRAKFEKQLMKDEYDLYWWAKQQDTYFDWKLDVTDQFDTRSEKILCALTLSGTCLPGYQGWYLRKDSKSLVRILAILPGHALSCFH